MSNFIELHDLTGELVIIGINHICSYNWSGTGTDISLVNGVHFIVKESSKEVKCAIIDAKESFTPRHL